MSGFRVAQVAEAVTRGLRAGGVDEAAGEMRALLKRFGIDPRLDGDTVLCADQHTAILAAAQRRAAGEPLAYIAGAQGFWSFDMAVSGEVLIPRPESEHVVETVLALAPNARRVLDLGVGSGAILLAVLHELPLAWGVGVDRSAGALEVARANAHAFGLSDRAVFARGDWACPVAASGGRAFDVVVSNPPYIPTRDIDGLQREVVDHEPRIALDGGADGLVFHRRIVAAAPALLSPGGVVVVECGSGQASDVGALMTAGGFDQLHLVRDLAGIERVVAARWSP